MLVISLVLPKHKNCDVHDSEDPEEEQCRRAAERGTAPTNVIRPNASIDVKAIATYGERLPGWDFAQDRREHALAAHPIDAKSLIGTLASCFVVVAAANNPGAWAERQPLGVPEPACH